MRGVGFGPPPISKEVVRVAPEKKRSGRAQPSVPLEGVRRARPWGL
jgi:hypothetical protein